MTNINIRTIPLCIDLLFLFLIYILEKKINHLVKIKILNPSCNGIFKWITILIYSLIKLLGNFNKSLIIIADICAD